MSRKLHVHNRKSYPPRTYCGLSAALVATNAWELGSGETCERCARSQEAERAAIARAVGPASQATGGDL